MPLAVTSMTPHRRQQLSDTRLREAVAAVVRRLVPPDEVDDVVQAAFTEALAAQNTPEAPDDLRRWVTGIARHKAADLHRRRRREQVGDTPEVEAPSGPQSASELLRWAERELPDGDGAHQTLDWMLREGAGEKLESIAESEQIPAPRVRQRVARLRKHFRERWAAQTAIGAAVLIALGVALWAWRKMSPPERIVRDVPSSTVPFQNDGDPIQRARELRKVAFEDCKNESWQRCIDGLDDAAKLDPEGDKNDEIRQARQAARDHLAPPIDSSSPTAPSSSVPLRPTPAPTVGDLSVPRMKEDSSSSSDSLSISSTGGAKGVVSKPPPATNTSAPKDAQKPSKRDSFSK